MERGTYLAHRLALTLPTVVGLTALVFFLLHAVVPADTVDLMVAGYGANDPALAGRLREEFGLTGPLAGRYLDWLGGVVRGDLGESLYTRRSVAGELATRLPVSVELGLGALLLTIVVGTPIGVLAAARQDTLPDYLLRGGAILINAVPGFWAATLVLVFGSAWFGWAPPLRYRAPWEDPLANLAIVALPMVLLGLSPVGATIRLVRTQVLEVRRQDYVRTAEAKGLAPHDVYYRHVLRNAMLPLVTLIGLHLPRLVAGSVVFEQIFGLPGMGRYLLQAVARLDYPVIQAVNLVVGVTLIGASLLVDLSYAWLDPRVRLR